MTLAANGIPVLAQSGGVMNMASGVYTGDGSGAITVPIGFSPREVEVIDVTDATKWEWFDSLPATNTLKTVTAGTQTIDTGSLIVSNNAQITVTEEAFGGNGPGEGVQGTVSLTIEAPNKANPQLVFASGLNTTGKVYAWKALAF